MALKKSTKRAQPPGALPHHRMPYKVGFEAENDSESSGAAVGNNRLDLYSSECQWRPCHLDVPQ